MNRELHTMAATVHGFLLFGHLLGAAYAWRRRNWLWVGFHVGALIGDAIAVDDHRKDAREAA